MKWTSERPTAEGYHWYRVTVGTRTCVRVVELTPSRDDREGLKVWCSGYHTSLKSWPGEWFGPITPPP